MVVHITLRESASGLIDSLKQAGYGVTALEAQGATGPVQVIFSVIKRKELTRVVAIIKGCEPKAFYSVNDLKTAVEGIFPAPKRGWRGLIPMLEVPPRVIERLPAQTH